jgi:hypothetical protein
MKLPVLSGDVRESCFCEDYREAAKLTVGLFLVRRFAFSPRGAEGHFCSRFF